MLLINILSLLIPILISIVISSPISFSTISILMCKRKCKAYGGCTSVRYTIKDLLCEPIFGNNKWDKGNKDRIILKVRRNKLSPLCGQIERKINTKQGSMKCVKVVKTDADEELPCILFRKENIIIPAGGSTHIDLPIKVKKGMKLKVCGRYHEELPYSQLSVSKTPQHPTNPFTWLHIRAEWKTVRVAFTDGTKNYFFQGQFPIQDPSNFTTTLMLTSDSTLVYVDRTLVNTKKPIPWINTVNFRKYSKIHLVVVQRTAEECDNVNPGFP